MHGLTSQFTDLVSRLGSWGYALVFLVVMLECQALLGLFMPGESLVLVAGFLAGQQALDIRILIATVASAAIVGDTIGFELGRKFGREWLRRHGARVGIRDEHFARIDAFIARHGGKSVFLSHFLHIFRALMPFIAGANRMPYRRFVGYNALGCVLWATIFSLLGYFFGESWPIVEHWIGRAGAIVGAVIVALVILGRLWTWLTQHEIELRNRWAAFLARPAIAAFRRRFAGQIEFIEERLSPGGYLGLHLTAGAIVVLLSGWWFGGIVDLVKHHDPLGSFDYQVVDWFNQHATPTVTDVAIGLTFLGSGTFLTAASLAVGMALLAGRRWHRLATLALTVGGGALLNSGVKHLFQRARPVVEHPLVHLTSYSFPSGHTAGATLFFGLMALFLMQDAARWRWRVLPPLVACLVILLVGTSRVYLGAHYLTDVLGAIALSILWLAFTATAVEVNRRYHETHNGKAPSVRDLDECRPRR